MDCMTFSSAVAAQTKKRSKKRNNHRKRLIAGAFFISKLLSTILIPREQEAKKPETDVGLPCCSQVCRLPGLGLH